ncbi:hypothetical protein NPX13_g11361 [Xylaria arbuscula]|uniref:Uncharacterized protein n=1 Tax=Xylaria arbuscula TaxID=114810 RepID=A0A9W8TFW9_9PEZI|nr:hypothetical protein NPX13_g11361 [Xylaria arbuscula]
MSTPLPRIVLLAAGADVNAPPADTGGVTSLQAAALSGYVRIATMLLDAGADTNGNGALEHGRTALEAAAEHGRIDMVQLLLNAGADLYGNGHIQYRKTDQLALINGHNAVRRLIEERIYRRKIVESVVPLWLGGVMVEALLCLECTLYSIDKSA